jgi:hypothetical protein
VIKLSDPLCFTTVTAPLPAMVPAVVTSAVSSVAAASRIDLSSMVLTSMLLAMPMVHALSS